MSVEKISIVYEQSIEILKEQSEVIKKTRKELFLLGKNYDNLLFSEFRKKLRGLIFFVDLEKHTNELNEALSKVDILISQGESSSTTSNEIQTLLELKSLLKDQEEALNDFKEAILELRDIKHYPPGNPNQKIQDQTQLKMFKNYLNDLSQKAQQMFPSLKKSLAQQENMFSIRMTVLLNSLSQFSSEGKINSLIQLILDGFFDNKMSKCKKNPEEDQFRISVSPKGSKRLDPNRNNTTSSAPPIFSFKF